MGLKISNDSNLSPTCILQKDHMYTERGQGVTHVNIVHNMVLDVKNESRKQSLLVFIYN